MASDHPDGGTIGPIHEYEGVSPHFVGIGVR